MSINMEYKKICAIKKKLEKLHKKHIFIIIQTMSYNGWSYSLCVENDKVYLPINISLTREEYI